MQLSFSLVTLTIILACVRAKNPLDELPKGFDPALDISTVFEFGGSRNLRQWNGWRKLDESDESEDNSDEPEDNSDDQARCDQFFCDFVVFKGKKIVEDFEVARTFFDPDPGPEGCLEFCNNLQDGSSDEGLVANYLGPFEQSPTTSFCRCSSKCVELVDLNPAEVEQIIVLYPPEGKDCDDYPIRIAPPPE